MQGISSAYFLGWILILFISASCWNKHEYKFMHRLVHNQPWYLHKYSFSVKYSVSNNFVLCNSSHVSALGPAFPSKDRWDRMFTGHVICITKKTLITFSYTKVKKLSSRCMHRTVDKSFMNASPTSFQFAAFIYIFYVLYCRLLL